jgi:hypothetical protein
VFFRMVGLNDDTEAIGAQGIPLTAGRSIAVDKALHAYGTPFFIEADLSLPGTPGQSRFRRDLFFGAGEEAGKLAGLIQQFGRLAMLVPRELGSSVISASVPLPPAKPVPSLASYGFRPVVSRAKSEPSLASGSLRPATLNPVVLRRARPEPSQVAVRALSPAPLHPVSPLPEKPERATPRSESSRGVAHMLRPEERPPPAKSRPSQVAARAMLHSVSSTQAGHEPSQVAARPLHPAEQPPPAKPEPSPVTARALHPVWLPAAAGSHVLRPAAPAPARSGLPQVAARARRASANLASQQARRGAVHAMTPARGGLRASPVGVAGSSQ